MWMNRHTAKLACGAKNGVAIRPIQRLMKSFDDAA